MKAPCKYYRKCSGCTLLANPYVRQLFGKDRLVAERLSSLRLPDKTISKIFPSPNPLAYRSSAKLCLNQDSQGQRSIGLYKFGTKIVIDIPDCPVQVPGINKLVQRLFSDASKLPAEFYQHAKRGFQTGRLKFITLRYCASTGEAGVVISHTGVDKKALQAWLAGLKLPRISVYGSLLTREDKDLVVSEQCEWLYGPATFQFALAGLRFSLSPLAFFQANMALADIFIAGIVPEIEKGARLLDLYGGFGAYSLVAAPRFAALEVVDGNKSATLAARANAEMLGVKHLHAQHASIEDFLERRYSQKSRQETSHIIVNPPRGGLSAHVKEKLHAKLWPSAEILTYVSCNLDTLTRDLHDLVKRRGWHILNVQPYDMFPQTEHIELVVKLSRQPSPLNT